jgi:hypothetical protein
VGRSWPYGGLSRVKISGTQDGPFRAIASLLYEAITGEADLDLKRACDSVLRDASGKMTRQIRRKGHTDGLLFDPMYPIVIKDHDKSA